MMLKNFGQMEQFVREQSGKKRVALAAAHDADALGSLMPWTAALPRPF